jgi:benzoate-CoA ligase
MPSKKRRTIANIATALLERALQKGPADREFARCGQDRVSVGEFGRLVNQVGGAVGQSGVAPGERVVISLPDSVEFAAAYLGVMRQGAVAVPTNPGLRTLDLAYALRESGARLLILSGSLSPQLGSVPDELPHLRTVVVVGASDDRYMSWNDWLGAAEPADPVGDVRLEDPAFWLWTSGSTGTPKAAIHHHHDWVACCQCYAEGVLRMSPTDVVFSAAKAFHAYGLGNGTVFPLYTGGRTIYLAERATPEAILETVARERPTLLFAVPTMYAGMLACSEESGGHDLTSLRACVSAGEALPAEICRRWSRRFGVEILDGIGSTEVLHIYLSARPGSVRPGSSGTPVDGYSIRILNEEGSEVPVGEVGDLWVRGASTASAYWRRPELTRVRMRNGWFLTGDKYRVDPNGYYWYVGRSDDMFKVGAEWVSPTEVERVLVEDPSVLESAVVPVPDSQGLLRARAFVVTRGGALAPSVVEKDLRALAERRLPRTARPTSYTFVPELPKSPAGKIQRYLLKAKGESARN